MSRLQRGSIFASIIGILICGVAGGYSAWLLVSNLGIDGAIGAFIAAVIGMIVATALWAGGSALLRAFGWIR
jgi:dolichol kinase